MSKSKLVPEGDQFRMKAEKDLAYQENQAVTRVIRCSSCDFLMWFKRIDNWFECEMCDNIKLINNK